VINQLLVNDGLRGAGERVVVKEDEGDGRLGIGEHGEDGEQGGCRYNRDS
jgi:hypothetical protein